MSRYVEQASFQVHYGDGYISHDAYGVDLSAFERRECRIDKPLERSFGSIRKWLHEIFNVNLKTHFLTVQIVTNWGTKGDFWDLRMDLRAIFSLKFFSQMPLPPRCPATRRGRPAAGRPGYIPVNFQIENIF